MRQKSEIRVRDGPQQSQKRTGVWKGQSGHNLSRITVSSHGLFRDR
jgi:hypothetical protein